jgi:hypothetical protein
MTPAYMSIIKEKKAMIPKQEILEYADEMELRTQVEIENLEGERNELEEQIAELADQLDGVEKRLEHMECQATSMVALQDMNVLAEICEQIAFCQDYKSAYWQAVGWYEAQLWMMEREANREMVEDVVEPPEQELDTGASVYLISSSGLAKIGVSRSPEQRVKTLQASSPEMLCLLGEKYFKCSRDAYEIEKELHLRFKDKRGHGEWFDLTDGDINAILSEYII